MKKTNLIWLIGIFALAAMATTTYFFTTEYLMWDVTTYALCSVAYFLEGAALFGLLSAANHSPKKTALLFALLGGVGVAGVVVLLTYPVNVYLFHYKGNVVIPIITDVLLAALSVFFVVRLAALTGKKWNWKPVLALSLSIVILDASILSFLPAFRDWTYVMSKHKEADPLVYSTYTKKQLSPVGNADLYVAPDGSDENDGTFIHPLATIEEARDRVRGMDKTGRNGIVVALKAGEYTATKIEFTAEDGGTESCPITYRAYGDGEVIINGGKMLDPSIFAPVTDASVLARLTPTAAQKVVCANLTELGLTANDWGKLYPVGNYGTAEQYTGDTTGAPPCVLYYNGEPLTTARYPNSGFLTVQGIVREGDGWETSTSNHAKKEGWKDRMDPETDIFTIDDETAERIHSYASLDTVWLWTALMYNWADTTVPLKNFDYANKTLEPAYVSIYGAVAGSTYYIFNVIEELDSPGEWYLDRDSGMVYLYPTGDISAAEVSISLTTNDLITVTDAPYLRFEGLSVRGTRGNGIVINSNDVTVENCFISDLSGIGIKINGYRNTVTDCELAHIGAAGVDVKGGDRETLASGKNKVENCLIHDYSEVALTAGPGVNIYGVGNVCSHNEFYNSPQQAIIYGGNDTIIEYNLIHHVALLSDDCSAIYAGRRWDYNGCVVRYNVLYDLGDEDHAPSGIYWDDGLSGQTAYGNLIVNCKANAFLIGGGRDNNVYNNILIDCYHPVSYDERSRDGVLYPESWFEHSREGADMQQNLLASPWQSDVWQQAYPYIKNWVLDYTDTENEYFIPNPANSRIYDNLIVHHYKSVGDIAPGVYRFSDIKNNAVYGFNQSKKLFVDPENGDYRLKENAPIYRKVPDFESIPLDEVGRNK